MRSDNDGASEINEINDSNEISENNENNGTSNIDVLGQIAFGIFGFYFPRLTPVVIRFLGRLHVVDFILCISWR
jgi:hypothetical protein